MENRDAAITYKVSPPVNNQELNELFAASWEGHSWANFEQVLTYNLGHVCAYQAKRLIGFVKLAWDGGQHAFILDTTVHPDVRRQGIGLELVRQAIELARQHGCEWVHVDYEPHLDEFYRQCGFRPTLAGLVNLSRG